MCGVLGLVGSVSVGIAVVARCRLAIGFSDGRGQAALADFRSGASTCSIHKRVCLVALWCTPLLLAKYRRLALPGATLQVGPSIAAKPNLLVRRGIGAPPAIRRFCSICLASNCAKCASLLTFAPFEPVLLSQEIP